MYGYVSSIVVCIGVCGMERPALRWGVLDAAGKNLYTQSVRLYMYVCLSVDCCSRLVCVERSDPIYEGVVLDTAGAYIFTDDSYTIGTRAHAQGTDPRVAVGP